MLPSFFFGLKLGYVFVFNFEFPSEVADFSVDLVVLSEVLFYGGKVDPELLIGTGEFHVPFVRIFQHSQVSLKLDLIVLNRFILL